MWIKNADAATLDRFSRGSGNEGNIYRQSFDTNLSFGNAPEGKYTPDEDKWRYKPDNRGKYVHIPFPYDG